MGKIILLNQENDSRELQTNINFDTVIETRKPESVNSGFRITNSLDSLHESGKNGTINTSILSDMPNLYKNNGVFMSNSGYFIIPRSLANDSRFLCARLKYQKVFFTILKHAAYYSTTYAIGVDIIPIQIGQLCVSERYLVNLCNQNVKFEEDLVDKNIVRRAIHYFIKCHFVNQQVIHGKTLLTITIPEFYINKKNDSEPTSESKVNQNRTTNKEYKELKEDNIIFNADDTSDSAIASSEKKKISSYSRKRKKVEPALLIERDAGIFTSDLAHQKLIEHWKSEETVKQIYSAMAVWKAQKGITSGDDYKTALSWHITPKKPQSSYQKPQPNYNHDTSPRNPKKNISFAEEV